MKIDKSRRYRLMSGVFAGGGVFSLVFFTGASPLVVGLLTPVIAVGAVLLSIAIEAIREGL